MASLDTAPAVPLKAAPTKPRLPVGTLIGLGLLVLAALPLLLGASNYMLGLLISALILSGVALAWALLGNLGGMVSFGHAAFFGVGAYASALLAGKLGLPAADRAARRLVAVVASLAMLPALRLSGLTSRSPSSPTRRSSASWRRRRPG